MSYGFVDTSVREYSVFGGTTGYILRLIISDSPNSTQKTVFNALKSLDELTPTQQA